MTVNEYNNMDGRYRGYFEIDGEILRNYLVRDIWSNRVVGDMITSWENLCEDYPEATLEDFLEDVDLDLNCMTPDVALVPVEATHDLTITDESGNKLVFCFTTEEDLNEAIDWWLEDDTVRIEKGVRL